MAEYDSQRVKEISNVIGEIYRVVGDYRDANSLVSGGKNIDGLESLLGSAMKELPADIMYPELGKKLSILRGAVKEIKEKNKSLGRMRHSF